MVIMSFTGDYAFLSNFYPVDVIYDGWKYRTVEHAYQAAKTLDLYMRDAIRSCRKPGLAKTFGRAAELRPGWDEIKLSVMADLLRQKFTVREDLKARLLETGDATLVEGNHWHDVWWGVCNGRGENHLGILLMEIRDELARQA